MKAKLTPEAAQALVALHPSRDWRVVVNWMADTASEWNQACVMADDTDRRAITAGMARAMSLFVAAIEEAPQVLQQMKENRNG